jgi:hypothetical protein
MTDATEDRRRIADAERPLTLIDTTGDCWQWTGSTTDQGYGFFYLGAEKVYAHRWFYELVAGPIPDGLVIDHRCRNRACARPSHLEPVTNAENILRGEGFGAKNAAKTTCPEGHPYTVFAPRKAGGGARGSRRCRICDRSRARAAMAASRGKGESARMPCAECGLPYAIKANGTVYRHVGMDAAGFSTGEQCPGAGKPPAAAP